MENNFTYRQYLNIINKFLDKNYKIIFYQNFKNSFKKKLIIRHDVDFSIEYAFKMAKIEKENSIKSNYFFMLSSPFYNLFSKDSQRMIEEISNFGHSVNLHFDASIYANLKNIKKYIKKEIIIFEKLIKKKCSIISFHRPSKELLCLKKNLIGFKHTYENNFFKKIGYVSDSSGYWKFGHPLEMKEFNENKSIQFLTHPIWWQNTNKPYKEKLNNFLQKKFSYFDNQLAVECKSHNSGKVKINFND